MLEPSESLVFAAFQAGASIQNEGLSSLGSESGQLAFTDRYGLRTGHI